MSEHPRGGFVSHVGLIGDSTGIVEFKKLTEVNPTVMINVSWTYFMSVSVFVQSEQKNPVLSSLLSTQNEHGITQSEARLFSSLFITEGKKHDMVALVETWDLSTRQARSMPFLYTQEPDLTSSSEHRHGTFVHCLT